MTDRASYAGHRRVSFESLERIQLTPDAAASHEALARDEVRIAIGRTTVAVRFSRNSAATIFAERFVEMLGSASATIVVYAVVSQGAAYFWQSPTRVYRWPADPSDEVLVFFADAVAIHEYLATSVDLGLHAAVIALGTRLVSLVGRSTAGKTTTALAAVRRGFALYSDDRCIIQAGRVVPYLRALTLREGGRRVLMREAPPDCNLISGLSDLPERGDRALNPRRLLGERAGGPPQPLEALFLIAGREDTPRVERCSIYSAFPELLRSFVCQDQGLERGARALLEFRGLPLYRLTLGAPDATAVAIERTLDETVADARS